MEKHRKTYLLNTDLEAGEIVYCVISHYRGQRIVVRAEFIRSCHKRAHLYVVRQANGECMRVRRDDCFKSYDDAVKEVMG